MTTTRGWTQGAEADRLEALLALHEVALDTMAHGLCMFDADHRVVLFNRRYIQMFNLSPEVVRPGVAFRDVLAHSAERGNFSPAALDAEWRKRWDRLVLGRPFSMHQPMPGGGTIAMHFRPMPGGGWVTIFEDVTAQQRMQDELRIQVERLKQAVGHMSHGLCLFDADERLIVCNEQYLRMYSLDPAVVKPGITFRDALAHAVSIRNVHMTADEFYARRIAMVRRRETVTEQLRLSDGRVIETTVRPIEDGGWVADHEDITVRLRAEEKLREQNMLFDAGLENMAHGLCTYDRDLRVIVRNSRYLEMYRLDPDDAQPGTPLVELMRTSIARGVHEPGSTAERMAADFKQRLIDNKEPMLHRRLADGRIIAVRHRPMANGGWVGTYEDITERERAAQAIREQNLRFDAALNNMSQGLCMYDADNRLIVCNERYVTLFDADPAVVRPGATLREIFADGVARGLYPGTVDELMARRLGALAKRRPLAYEQEVAGGRTLSVSICPMSNGGWVGTFEDITERKRAEAERAAAQEALAEQNLRFDAALNNMTQGLCMLDAELRVIVTNRRYLEMYRFSTEVVRPGATMRDIMEHTVALGNYTGMTAGELYAAYAERLKTGTNTILRELADGRVIKISHQLMAHGGWVTTHEDVTERHRAEQSIARMARHDALTDLPNRLLLREKMAEGLARVAARQETMAVFCLDLDNFKSVNDTLGHPIGDKLLQAVAERLGRAVAAGDTVARLGGDEFAILQSATSPAAAEALARRLIEVNAEPIVVDGQELNAGISVGIALAPEHGTEADDLMKCADLALYRAKSEGRGMFRLFEPEMDARIQARRALELDLRKALTAGQLELAYQPLVSLATNELLGMEALLRWTNGERGPVSPAEFIPVAEETGLIVPIGEWVLRRACAEAARWPDSVRIAVNLSPVQFRSRGFVATVTHALAAAGLPARRLELEITEAVLLAHDETVVAMLHQLRALGVRISMDDFGTGYSSLSYLRSFPFDKIKIDRSFISDVDRNRDSAAIIRAIAGLGASLGIETTAEGVETPEQLEVVRRAGCTEVQGYLLGRPRPAAEALELIARGQRDIAAA